MKGPATVRCAATPASSDEGMWTFDNFPLAKANRELGTDIDQAWLERVRLASVKVGGFLYDVDTGLLEPIG